MPKIAVVVSGLSGRLHSGFELISRLKSEGHEVICLCQPYSTVTVARQGFKYLEIPEINFKYSDPDNLGSDLDFNSRSNFKRETVFKKLSESNPSMNVARTSWIQKCTDHFKYRKTRYEQGKDRLKLEEYERMWSELKPDHTLIDVELHDLIFTAYASQIPFTLFHTWFSDTPSKGLPPIRTDIIPGKGLKGSTSGIVWARFVDRAKIRLRLYINRLTFKEYRRSTLKEYARKINFPVSDLALSTLPPLYRFTKIPILLLALKELDFPHRPDPNIRYIGPMVYENRQDLPENSIEGQRLQALFEIRKNKDIKLIYCSVGSVEKGDMSYLRRVIQVVGEQKNWLLILSLGRNLAPKNFPFLPENVHLFHWAPQLKVLSHADVCINHAGINSINECLHFGVPMLTYSSKFYDQNGNSARMAYHGLGISGDKDIDDAAAIRENLKAVLSNPKYRETVKKYNRIYNDYRQRKLSPYLFRSKESLFPSKKF